MATPRLTLGRMQLQLAVDLGGRKTMKRKGRVQTEQYKKKTKKMLIEFRCVCVYIYIYIYMIKVKLSL
jgi:hypothetical protein